MKTSMSLEEVAIEAIREGIVVDFGSDKQATFNRVVRHLAQQKMRAFDTKAGVCRFRFGTLKCAIGCEIPDELYRKWMESWHFTSLVNERVFKGEDSLQRMLIALQITHDNSNQSAEQLRDHLRYIAHENGLDASAVQDITEWDSGSAA